MKKTNIFIILFLATILVIRTILYFIPKTNIVYSDFFHHSFIGLAFILIYFMIRKYNFSYYFLAITLGIIADQISAAPFYITYLLNTPLAPHSFWKYWSPYSLISTIIIIIISIILIKRVNKEK